MIRGPKFESPSIPMDTAPNINIGPDVLVKQSNLSPSVFVIIFFSLNLDVNFEPTGYPDNTDMERGNIPSPEVLKTGLIRGLNIPPSISTNPNEINSSEMIKKGSKEGKMTLNHIRAPWLADCIDTEGLDIIPHRITISTNKKGIFE